MNESPAHPSETQRPSPRLGRVSGWQEALRGRAVAHPGSCGRRGRARSPERTCSGRSPGGSRTSRASRGCPRRIRSRLRRSRFVSDSAPQRGASCGREIPLRRGWGWRWDRSMGEPGGEAHRTSPAPGPSGAPRTPEARPLPRSAARSALTAAGPAALAAVARLTGDALEAPGFVLAFAVGAGAGVPALVNVCAGGRRAR